MNAVKDMEDRREDIQRHLDTINCRARTHTADAGTIIRTALIAEAELADLGIPVKHRIGARVRATSGDALPKAYAKHGRTVIRTTFELLRRSRGWTLASAEARSYFVNQNPGGVRLTLTAEQDAIAVAKTRARYFVPPTEKESA